MISKVELIRSNHKKSWNEILRRVTWFIIWKLFASWTPRSFNKWRIFLLRLYGGNIGNKVLVLGSVWVDMPWNLTVGDFSAIGKRVWVYNFGKVIIGSNTVISQDSILCTSSHDFSHPHMPLFSKPIRIENYAWVAASSFIMPGVTIKEGSVIGARSVVTKDMPSWTVCAGHPCKPIKKREMNQN